MSDAVDRVRELVQRLREIDVERESIATELAEIRDVMGLKPPVTVTNRKRSKPWSPNRKGNLRQGTLVYWAEKVISQKRTPIYINDLVNYIEQLSGLRVEKASLVSNLSRYVRSGVVFSRPREGYYGLLELE